MIILIIMIILYLTCRQVWEWRAPNRRIGRGDLYPWLRGLWCRVSGHRNSWWRQWSWSGGCRTEWSSPPRSPSGRTWSPGPPRWSQCTETFNPIKFFVPVFALIMVCLLVFVTGKTGGPGDRLRQDCSVGFQNCPDLWWQPASGGVILLISISFTNFIMNNLRLTFRLADWLQTDTTKYCALSALSCLKTEIKILSSLNCHWMNGQLLMK